MYIAWYVSKGKIIYYWFNNPTDPPDLIFLMFDDDDFGYSIFLIVKNLCIIYTCHDHDDDSVPHFFFPHLLLLFLFVF